MNEFVDIFGEVVRIVTFQPREARVRYRLPEWEERMEVPERKAPTSQPSLRRG